MTMAEEGQSSEEDRAESPKPTEECEPSAFEQFLSSVDQFKISLEYKYRGVDGEETSSNRMQTCEPSSSSSSYSDQTDLSSLAAAQDGDADADANAHFSSSSKLRTQHCNLDSLLCGQGGQDETVDEDGKTANYQLDVDVDVVLLAAGDEDDVGAGKSREDGMLLSPQRFLNTTENDASDLDSELERRHDSEPVATHDRHVLVELNEEKEFTLAVSNDSEEDDRHMEMSSEPTVVFAGPSASQLSSAVVRGAESEIDISKLHLNVNESLEETASSDRLKEVILDIEKDLEESRYNSQYFFL